MKSYVEIEPADLVQFITRISINVLNINLNESATIQVLCYSESNEILMTYCFELVDEYFLWTTDEWLYEYCLNKYGFVKKQN